MSSWRNDVAPKKQLHQCILALIEKKEGEKTFLTRKKYLIYDPSNQNIQIIRERETGRQKETLTYIQIERKRGREEEEEEEVRSILTYSYNTTKGKT